MPDTLILSDLHLGRPRYSAGGAAALEALVGSCRRLVINGDAAELEDPAHRSRAERELASLRALCRSRGTRLTLVAGNHDPRVTTRHTLRLFRGRVLVTHGDAFFAGDSCVPASLFQHRLSRVPLGENRLRPFLPRRIADWVHLPEEIRVALATWSRGPSLAARYAALRAPVSRVVVTGHWHRGGVWRRAGRWVINTGGFSPLGRPCAVGLDGARVRVWPLVRAGAGLRLGDGTWLDVRIAPT